MSSQDVIVKHDGNTILAKVLEVNPSDIKYKKISNQTGPTYTIEKSEVMVINYENGERDVFTKKDSSNLPSKNSDVTSDSLAEENLKFVREYNQKVPVFKGNPKRKSDFYIGILGIKEGSVLETPDVKVVFATINSQESHKICTSIINKTDDIIYIDKAKSFFITGSEYTPYYVPSSSSSGSSESSGIGMNLGAVTGVLGIGGALGTLANGISVGQGTTTSESTTIYAQRIIAIPPHASVNIGENYLIYWDLQNHMISFLVQKHIPFMMSCGFLSEKKKRYVVDYGKMNNGEIIHVPFVEDATMSVLLTYSKTEDMSASQSIRTDFFLKDIMGLAKWSYSEVELSTMPLYFSMRFLAPGWFNYIYK